MKLALLTLVLLLQTSMVFSNEYSLIEMSTPPINANPPHIPAQVTKFLNDNPQTAARTAGAQAPTNSHPFNIVAQVVEFLKANAHISAVNAPVSPDTKCECAVFNSKTPAETDKPILTRAPVNVDCDETGEENCLKLCSALVQLAREGVLQLLCSHLVHYSHLTASIYSRVCGAQKWTYTGLTLPVEICCYENKVIDCGDQVAEPVSPPPN